MVIDISKQTREKYMPKQAPARKSIVIGVRPDTGEVLVKDTATGKMEWKPGTKEQIEQASREIRGLPETPEAKLRQIAYKPPSKGWLETAKEIGRQAWREITPWKEEKGETVTPKGAAVMAAELIVPGVYVGRRWKELSPAERALSIGIDALSLIPFAGAAARGARAVPTAARAARVAAAAKAVGKEAVITAKAPVDAIIHPVSAAKSTARELRNIVETVAHPKKIPEVVLTTTEGTTRLKISEATTPAEAMAARDAVMRAAAKGERPVVRVGNVEVELAQSPLMREAGGGVVHTTPTGGALEKGLTVQTKAGMPASEQGLFVAHQPLPRFAKQSAFNKPVVIETGKTAQVVKTRYGAGQVIELHLEKPLPDKVVRQLSKGKLIETADKPVEALSKAKVRKLAKALEQAGNPEAAKALVGTVESYKPIFRIMSPEKAAEAITTGKIYRGTAEMELKFPVGAEIPPPKQKLFTRIGEMSDKVEIWLDKPLSARQIAKLKAEGLVEWIKTPFKPPIKVSGVSKPLTEAEAMRLADILADTGNPRVASALRRSYRAISAPRAIAPPLSRATGRTGRAERVLKERAAVPARARDRIPEQLAWVRLPEYIDVTGRRPEREEGAERRVARAIRKTREERIVETREREREQDREERERIREPEREPEPEREKERERETSTEKERELERERDKGREKEKEKQREKEQDKERRKLELAAGRGRESEREAAISGKVASIVWRQGMLKQQDGKLKPVWKVVDLEKGRVYTTFSKPEKAYEATGAMSAYKTAQRIGKGKLPRKILVDMGVVDIEIGHKPMPSGKGTRIRYKAKGKGLKTDISGTGNPLVGLSIVR